MTQLRTVPRATRRDAVENQERVLAAAVSTMLRDGRQVPMAVIAAEAGVGVATLYRKYPHREALLDALTERAFRILADLAEDVCAQGGTGLHQLDNYWDGLIGEYDQLVLPLGGGPPVAASARAEQRRLHRALKQLLATGHADGTIRSDLSFHDVILFGAMLVTPTFGTSNWRRVALRQKEIHLAGLAGPAAG